MKYVPTIDKFTELLLVFSVYQLAEFSTQSV